MPMNQFGDIRLVDYIDRDGLAFLHTQHRAGRSAVIADRTDNSRRREFYRDGRDAQCEIRLGGFLCRRGRRHAGHGWLRLRKQHPRRAQLRRGDSAILQEFPSVQSILPQVRWARRSLLRHSAEAESSHDGRIGSSQAV